MPTMDHRARCQMMGTLALRPPYGTVNVTARRANQFRFSEINVKRTVSDNQKYFASVFTQIGGITAPVSPRDEGRWPSSPTRGEMRWTPMP